MLYTALPTPGVQAPSSQRSSAGRLTKDVLGVRTLARGPCRRGSNHQLDQNVKLRTPLRRLVGVSSSAAASSGGFFDSKLPEGYEGAGSQAPKQDTPAPDEPVQQEPVQEKPASRLKLLLTPLSDPVANSRLLALCFAQTLCSVATLIHDTYLPVYLQDVLGMSNQKVSNALM